jgi:hypothetical protein
MKVININFEAKTFTTTDGEEYPFMFNVDESITLDEFQSLIDKSEETLRKLL